jgi:hypothetical protein
MSLDFMFMEQLASGGQLPGPGSSGKLAGNRQSKSVYLYRLITSGQT